VNLVTKTDKTTVGAICDRVTTDVLDPGRLSGLMGIGVDTVLEQARTARMRRYALDFHLSTRLFIMSE
jgi:predicted HAD superfamily phosphohydrolase YqeG